MLCVFVVRDARLYVGMVHVREATLRVLSLLLGHTARGIFDTPQLLTVGAPRSDTTKRKTADGSLTSKILSEMVRGKKAKYENGWAGRCVLPVKVIYLWGGACISNPLDLAGVATQATTVWNDPMAALTA